MINHLLSFVITPTGLINRLLELPINTINNDTSFNNKDLYLVFLNPSNGTRFTIGPKKYNYIPPASPKPSPRPSPSPIALSLVKPGLPIINPVNMNGIPVANKYTYKMNWSSTNAVGDALITLNTVASPITPVAPLVLRDINGDSGYISYNLNPNKQYKFSITTYNSNKSLSTLKEQIFTTPKVPAPNLPIYVSKTSTALTTYNLNLRVVKKQGSDYNNLEVKLFDGLTEISRTILINNIRNNIISFPTDINFTINNLIKTKVYDIVLDTINSNSIATRTDTSELTVKKRINIFNLLNSLSGGYYTKKRKTILKKNKTEKYYSNRKRKNRTEKHKDYK